MHTYWASNILVRQLKTEMYWATGFQSFFLSGLCLPDKTWLISAPSFYNLFKDRLLAFIQLQTYYKFYTSLHFQNFLQVSALAFDGHTDILASAQTGSPSVIRIWKYHSRKCAAMFRAEVHNVHCIR